MSAVELSVPAYKVRLMTKGNRLLISLVREAMADPKDLEVSTKTIRNVAIKEIVKTKDPIEEAIIGGPMPLWFASALVHELAHLVETVALFDPKMKKAIVVTAHAPGRVPGQLLDLDEDEIAFLAGV